MTKKKKNHRTNNNCPKCGLELSKVHKKVYKIRNVNYGSVTDNICTNDGCSVSLVIIETIYGTWKRARERIVGRNGKNLSWTK